MLSEPATASQSEPEQLERPFSEGEQEALLQELESEFQKAKRRLQTQIWLLALLNGVIWIPVLIGTWQGWLTNTMAWGLIYILFFCVQLSSLPIQTRITSGKLLPTLEKASHVQDTRLVGILLDTHPLAPANHRQYIRLLTRLLPQMKASEAKQLTAKQRKELYKALPLSEGWEEYFTNARPKRQTFFSRLLSRPDVDVVNDEYVDLIVALLGALEQIGDRAALPIVEQLAALPVSTPEGRRVQKAAQECLPALQLLVEERRTEEELLRPAEAEEARANELLRASRSGTDTEPTELLRAGESSQQATVEKYPQG